jgi:ABC-type lipoprotein export system ATPase subunit
MKIEFSSVIPEPLKDGYSASTDLWAKNLFFETPAFYLLRAPSGTGKSTFVSFLSGIRNDYTGIISVDGKNLKSFNLKDWSQLRTLQMAVVYQDLRLFHHLTGLENILIAPSKQKPTEKEIMDMAAELGMADKMKTSCGTLSLGQQQRVAILRAISHPFQLLLMDEPFSHLDEDNVRKACALIQRKCRENNAGLILTSLNSPYFIEYQKELNL